MPEVVWKERPPCAFDLYGQSMLRYSGIELHHLSEFATAVFYNTKIIAEEGEIASPRVKDGCVEYVDAVIDICEKLGLVWMAQKEISSIQSESESLKDGIWQPSKCGEVKYHFYNSIYHCKAAMDSCSILFNLAFGLSYKKEERDILRNEDFRKAIRESSPAFASYWDMHSNWFSNIRDIRDRLIHREYVPVLNRDIARKAVFDLVPNRITAGSTTRIDFIGFVGTKGKHRWQFRRKGMLLAFPHPFDYVFPRRPFNFKEILMGRAKRDMRDFCGVLDSCHTSFERLKGLSELAFLEALQKITR